MGNRYDVQHIHAAPKPDEKKAPKLTPATEFFAALGAVVLVVFVGIPLGLVVVQFWAHVLEPCYRYRCFW